MKLRTRLVSTMFVLAAASSLAFGQNVAREPFDVLIRGGKIVDGTGNPWFEGDVAIRGDRIAAVGPLGARCRRAAVIDARGLVVAPGFVDMHSHSDMTLLEDGTAQSKVRQGVTTEILGEDTSAGPAKGKRPPDRVKHGGGDAHLDDAGRILRRTREPGHRGQRRQLRRAGHAAGLRAGRLARPARRCAARSDEGAPRRGDARRRDRPLDDAGQPARAGRHHRRPGRTLRRWSSATGDSTRRTSATRGPRSSTPSRRPSPSAGGRSVPVDIIHLKIADQSLWGRMREIVALIDEARREGVNVQANVYPYTRGNNDLVSIIPPWAHEGGKGAAARPAQRSVAARPPEARHPDRPAGLVQPLHGRRRRLVAHADQRPSELRRTNGFEGQTMDQIIAAKSAAVDARPPTRSTCSSTSWSRKRARSARSTPITPRTT